MTLDDLLTALDNASPAERLRLCRDFDGSLDADVLDRIRWVDHPGISWLRRRVAAGPPGARLPPVKDAATRIQTGAGSVADAVCLALTPGSLSSDARELAADLRVLAEVVGPADSETLSGWLHPAAVMAAICSGSRELVARSLEPVGDSPAASLVGEGVRELHGRVLEHGSLLDEAWVRWAAGHHLAVLEVPGAPLPDVLPGPAERLTPTIELLKECEVGVLAMPLEVLLGQVLRAEMRATVDESGLGARLRRCAGGRVEVPEEMGFDPAALVPWAENESEAGRHVAAREAARLAYERGVLPGDELILYLARALELDDAELFLHLCDEHPDEHRPDYRSAVTELRTAASKLQPDLAPVFFRALWAPNHDQAALSELLRRRDEWVDSIPSFPEAAQQIATDLLHAHTGQVALRVEAEEVWRQRWTECERLVRPRLDTRLLDEESLTACLDSLSTDPITPEVAEVALSACRRLPPTRRLVALLHVAGRVERDRPEGEMLWQHALERAVHAAYELRHPSLLALRVRWIDELLDRDSLLHVSRAGLRLRKVFSQWSNSRDDPAELSGYLNELISIRQQAEDEGEDGVAVDASLATFRAVVRIGPTEERPFPAFLAEAWATMDSLEILAEETDRAGDLLETRLQVATALGQWGDRRPQRALVQSIKDGSALAGVSPAEHAAPLNGVVWVFLDDGLLAEAEALGKQALRVAEATGSREEVARAHGVLALAARPVHREHLEQAVELLEPQLPSRLSVTLRLELARLIGPSEPERAGVLLETGLREALEIGDAYGARECGHVCEDLGLEVPLAIDGQTPWAELPPELAAGLAADGDNLPDATRRWIADVLAEGAPLPRALEDGLQQVANDHARLLADPTLEVLLDRAGERGWEPTVRARLLLALGRSSEAVEVLRDPPPNCRTT